MHKANSTRVLPKYSAMRREFLNTHTAGVMRSHVLLEYPWAKRRHYEALCLRDECLAVASGDHDATEPSKLWH